MLLELGRCEASVELPRPDTGAGNMLQSSLLLATITRADNVDLDNTSSDQLGKVIQDIRRNLTKLQSSREGGGGVCEGMIQEIALSGELLLLSARLSRGLVLSQERNIQSLQLTFRTDLANKYELILLMFSRMSISKARLLKFRDLESIWIILKILTND